MSKNLRYMNNFIADKVEKARDRGIVSLTDFLEPPEASYAQTLLEGEGASLNYFFSGAYEGAERKRLSILPSWSSREDLDFQIILLEARAKKLMQEMSHRDLLGALLASGIPREKIGDIFVDKEKALVLLDRDEAFQLINNFPLIKGNSFDCQLLEPDHYDFPSQKYQEEVITVSSWRLDSFIARAWSISRNQAQAYINSGRVKVNHLECSKTNHLLKEEDLISLRGRGRFSIGPLLGQSKKGNYRVIINKFL